MDFDVNVTRGARRTRVEVRGEAGLGRLLSLLQVLELDSASWPQGTVLFDLRALQLQLTDAEQAQLAGEMARALPALEKIAVLAAPGTMREAAGVRVFDQEDAACHWLDQP